MTDLNFVNSLKRGTIVFVKSLSKDSVINTCCTSSPSDFGFTNIHLFRPHRELERVRGVYFF